MVGVDLADGQGRPVRRGDELPKCGHELLETKSPVPTSLLGDREVEEVEDVRVDVDEEALEASRPAVDDPTRGTRRVRRHLRQRDLLDAELVDRPSLEVGRAAVREQEDLFRAQHRRPRPDPGEAGNGVGEAEQVGDAHPVERAILDAQGCVQVGVVVDVDEPDIRRCTGGTGDRAELDGAVAAQHEHRSAVRQARAHLVRDRIHGPHVLRIDPPAEAGHVASVGDLDAALLEERW